MLIRHIALETDTSWVSPYCNGCITDDVGTYRVTRMYTLRHVPTGTGEYLMVRLSDTDVYLVTLVSTEEHQYIPDDTNNVRDNRCLTVYKGVYKDIYR